MSTVLDRQPATRQEKAARGGCRVCGCTDDDCRQCVEATGSPCWWVEPDLCSACVRAEPLLKALLSIAERARPWVREHKQGRPLHTATAACSWIFSEIEGVVAGLAGHAGLSAEDTET